MAARDEDFFGEGTVAQPTGGRPMTLAEQAALEEKRRVLRLQQSGTNTANINSRPGGYRDTRAASDQAAIAGSNAAVLADRKARGFGPEGNQQGLWENLKDSPETLAVLTAPYAVLGAGALAGGLAAGGVGSIATPAGASPYVGGAAGLAPTSAPFSMASPFAGGAPAATGAPFSMASPFGPGSLAAEPGLGSMIGSDLAKYGPRAAMAAAPLLINELTSGKTKEEKELLAKQEQLAQEAKVRQGQLQDQRMNALGQQVLAFNPRNQMMAEMFGPQAAYTPDQMATMVQGSPPPLDPALVNYKGNDPKILARVNEYLRRKQEFDQAESGRRDMIMGGIQQPGPGPAPFAMGPPQPARRF